MSAAGHRFKENGNSGAQFSEYVTRGWLLTPLEYATKQPRRKGWNRRENCVADPDVAAELVGAGLCHSYSGTAAVDVDDAERAALWLAERGIELRALTSARDAVMIDSGRPNRIKLLYRCDAPLPSFKLADGALELRCATQSGLSLQCALPPSIHPDTSEPYRWLYNDERGHWSNLPPLPREILRLWNSLGGRVGEYPPNGGPTAAGEQMGSPVSMERLREQLASHDPDCDYHRWIRAGMALHHDTGGSDAGLDLWDEWSARGKKYKGRDDLVPHWCSFRFDIANPVTAASLRVEKAARPDEFNILPGEPQTSTGTRPVVRVTGGELHNYAAQCESLLKSELYVRERALARIGGAPDISIEFSGVIRRDDSQAVILPASPEYLRRRLNQLARFESYRRREKDWVQIDCPKDLVSNIVGQGDWPNLRRLTAIARAPFVRADGTICEAPGYDLESLVFYAPNADFPTVPASPTREDAERALAALLEPFGEFPFSSDESRSAFLANIITEAVRPAVSASPAFCYTAPTAGTGKTLLSEMPSRIVHGCGPSMRPWVESSDELRKNLFASLLAGDRTLGYDNVPGGVKVRSPILCAFLTADVYSDRKLGASEVPALPNRSVVFLTGNNITPAGDLARRSVVVRLDANTDRLRERKFRILDLRSYVAMNRPALLVGALTIVRAYMTAGRPVQCVPLPSFEQWSRLVRDPLLWLGMADPMATQAAETDDEAAPLAAAFKLIAECPAIGDREFLASELATICDSIANDGTLAAAMEAAGCSSARDSSRVGYWLRDKRDRIAGGRKLERVRATDGFNKWRLRDV